MDDFERSARLEIAHIAKRERILDRSLRENMAIDCTLYTETPRGHRERGCEARLQGQGHVSDDIR